MNWKGALGLSIAALVLALAAYGLFFAEPRWVDIRIERVGGVTVL